MNIKKFTQKDRHGNMMSFEFDVPPMQESIPHPGAPVGTDTVPAWLTPGEFVMNAEATRMFKPQIEAMNEQGKVIQRMQGGTVPQYASEGAMITEPTGMDEMYEPLIIPPEQAMSWLQLVERGRQGMMEDLAAERAMGISEPTGLSPQEEEWLRVMKANKLQQDMQEEMMNPANRAIPDPIYRAPGGPVSVEDNILDLIDLSKTLEDPTAIETVNQQIRNLGEFESQRMLAEQEKRKSQMHGGNSVGVPTLVDTSYANPEYPTEINPIPTGINKPTGIDALVDMTKKGAEALGYGSAVRPKVNLPSELPLDGVPEETIPYEPVPTGESVMGGRGEMGMPSQPEEVVPPISEDTTPPVPSEEKPKPVETIVATPEDPPEKKEIAKSEALKLARTSLTTFDDDFGDTATTPTSVEERGLYNAGKEWFNKNVANADKDKVLGNVAKSLFDSIGDSGIIDSKFLAQSLVLYLGSRAMGYEHGASLRWTGKQYMSALQTKQAAEAKAKADAIAFRRELAKENYLQKGRVELKNIEQAGQDRRAKATNALKALEVQISGDRLSQDNRNDLIKSALDLVDQEHGKYNYNFTIEDAVNRLAPAYGLKASGVNQSMGSTPPANQGYNIATTKQTIAQLGGDPDKAPESFFLKQNLDLPSGRTLYGGQKFAMHQLGDNTHLVVFPDGSMERIPSRLLFKDVPDLYNTPEMMSRMGNLVDDVPTTVVDKESGKTISDKKAYNPAQLVSAMIKHYDNPEMGIDGTAFLAVNPSSYGLMSKYAQMARNYFDNTGKPVQNYTALIRSEQSGFFPIIEKDLLPNKQGEKKLSFEEVDNFVVRPITNYTRMLNVQGDQSTPQEAFSNLVQAYNLTSNPSATKPEGIPQEQWDDMTAFRVKYEKQLKAKQDARLPDQYAFILAYINEKSK